MTTENTFFSRQMEHILNHKKKSQSIQKKLQIIQSVLIYSGIELDIWEKPYNT